MPSESNSTTDVSPAPNAGSGFVCRTMRSTALDINDRLEASLEQFLAEAPIRDRVELLRFVPKHPVEDAQFILVELIKLDMAMIAEKGDRSENRGIP